MLDEDDKLGRRQPADIDALVATLNAQVDAANELKAARAQWSRRAPAYRRYRRSMNGAFNAFKSATPVLEKIKTMTGPPAREIGEAASRLAKADRNIAKVVPPEELAASHALVRSAWELAQNAMRLRVDSVSANNVAGEQQASSAAAGALMLYTKARADLTAQMERPSAKPFDRAQGK